MKLHELLAKMGEITIVNVVCDEGGKAEGYPEDLLQMLKKAVLHMGVSKIELIEDKLRIEVEEAENDE